MEVERGPGHRRGPGADRTMILGDLNAGRRPSPVRRYAAGLDRMLLRVDGGSGPRDRPRPRRGFVDAYRSLNPTESGRPCPPLRRPSGSTTSWSDVPLCPQSRRVGIGDASLPMMLAASDHLPLITVLDVSYRVPRHVAETPAPGLWGAPVAAPAPTMKARSIKETDMAELTTKKRDAEPEV